MAISESRASGMARKPKAALASIGINLLLIALKLAVALLTGSLAIMAEAAHSTLDLTASILALWGVSVSARPADEHHAFGHEKFENISSLAQMSLLALTCLWILYESGSRLIFGFDIEVTWYAFAVMAIAVALDYFASRYLRQTAGEAGGSAALEADSLHFQSDMWGALAVLVGLGLVAIAGFRMADPLAAIVVAGVIGVTAARSGLVTTNVLLDRAPSEALMEDVRQVIRSHPEVYGFHTLRARQAGSKILLDVRIALDSSTSLERTHELCHSVGDEIKRRVPQVVDVVVHAEPYVPGGPPLTRGSPGSPPPKVG
ncbi:MAG: cation diffusion facilitator family transporter [Dehalococcoidia bacterium]|nr:cation diffusion facilitator family transporter [Dehalococcoidia bacterium]